jgi:hypothetical protein
VVADVVADEVDVVEVDVVEVVEVVEVDIEPSGDGDDSSFEEGHLAPVVSLFAGEVDLPSMGDEPQAEQAPKASVDDLFAKLRASRTESVAASVVADETVDATMADETAADETASADHVAAVVADPTEELSVFQASPVAPPVTTEFDDSPFGRRDAELTPLIVAAARKLKRVLADEQNDVLHALRGQKQVTFAALLPGETEHLHRYADSIDAELRAAAVAGAASVDSRGASTHLKAVNKASATQLAIDTLSSAVVVPLRERLERAVIDTDGDPEDLVVAARAIYREWKTQRIDEHLDDVALAAFGRGQLVALKPGTPVCWGVDPNGPACPDAEDNALGGVVAAGDAFPTDHTCAPAHPGCRCMLLPAPR